MKINVIIVLLFGILSIQCKHQEEVEKQLFDIKQSKTIVTFIENNEYNRTPGIGFDLLICNNSTNSILLDPYNIYLVNDTLGLPIILFQYEKDKIREVHESIKIEQNTEKRIYVECYILNFSTYKDMQATMEFVKDYGLKFNINNELNEKRKYIFNIKDFYKDIEYRYYDTIIPKNELYKYKDFNIIVPLTLDQLPPKQY